MIINTDDYETLDQIAKRTSIGKYELSHLKGFPKEAFTLNNVKYYPKGFDPSGRENVNKGRAIPSKRRLHKYIYLYSQSESFVKSFMNEFVPYKNSFDGMYYAQNDDSIPNTPRVTLSVYYYNCDAEYAKKESKLISRCLKMDQHVFEKKEDRESWINHSNNERYKNIRRRESFIYTQKD